MDEQDQKDLYEGRVRRLAAEADQLILDLRNNPLLNRHRDLDEDAIRQMIGEARDTLDAYEHLMLKKERAEENLAKGIAELAKQRITEATIEVITEEIGQR